MNLWIPFALGPTTLASNALTIASSLNAAALAEAPFTVVRARGVITIYSDQSIAAENQEGILGFIVVKNTAVLIGASAVPDPLNEGNDDFFVYQPIQSQIMRLTSDVTTDGMTEVGKTEVNFDSKAMRKVDDGADIAIMLRNTSSAFGFVYIITGRMLVKLH